jgi:hypothetical protein
MHIIYANNFDHCIVLLLYIYKRKFENTILFRNFIGDALTLVVVVGENGGVQWLQQDTSTSLLFLPC